MPTKRIPSRKIMEIIALHTATTVSLRQLAKMFQISKSTVQKYLSAFSSSRLLLQDLAKLTDKDLHLALGCTSPRNSARQQALLDQMPKIHKRLADERTNLRQIWLEYRASDPLAYGYSQFVNLHAKWCKQNDLRWIRHHPWFLLIITEPDKATLKEWRSSSDRRKWERAVALLSLQEASNLAMISRKIERSRKTINQWRRAYLDKRLDGLDLSRRKTIDQKIRDTIKVKKERLSKLIHEAPSLHGINRTSWSLQTLCLQEGLWGKRVSKHCICVLFCDGLQI